MPKMTKSMCSGCEQNFYNGNNPYGVKECQNFQDAKVVKKIFIPIDMPPPYKGFKPESAPSCYDRYRWIKVDADRITKEGYWRSQMQIHNLVKPIDQQTDEELLERVRLMRQRREVLRPVAKAKAERVEKKATRAKVNKAAYLVDKLSEADRLKLIAMLTGEQA